MSLNIQYIESLEMTTYNRVNSYWIGAYYVKTRDLTITAMLIAILVVCSQLAIPVGPVPITLQTLAVLIIGFLLSPKNALFATAIYAGMGLAGLPVFSGFSGGLQSILAPSFGFVLAFIPAAYLQAKYLSKVNALESKHLLIAGLINFTVTYAIGLSYMAVILNVYMNAQMNLVGILMTGVIPFIPGDLIKLFTGMMMAKRLLPVVQKRYAMT